jgi:PIN domain nuclease of toxin-antitoxin system
MKLLLDTHALLWFLDNDPRLSAPAKAALLDADNERWLSPISLLEIAVKVRIGKLMLRAPFAELFPSQLIANRIQLVAIDSSHAEKVATMPLHHRDPFDRLIVAQTLIEQMTVVSVDPVLDAYGVSRLW